MSGRQSGRRELPPTPVATLDELIEAARRFGRDPEFARGGGGNASAKVDGVLYIKPSGVALATLAMAGTRTGAARETLFAVALALLAAPAADVARQLRRRAHAPSAKTQIGVLHEAFFS